LRILYRIWRSRIEFQNYQLLDMKKKKLSLMQTYKRHESWVHWQSARWQTGFKWEEENVVRHFRCHNCKLTTHNRTVLRQNVWETEGGLRAVLIDSLRIRTIPNNPPTANFPHNTVYIQILGTKKLLVSQKVIYQNLF